MLNGFYDLARPLALLLEPEHAHEMTLRSLEKGFYPRPRNGDPEILGQTIMGLHFPNPLGIAAGFDKNARVPGEIRNMGFGFSEIGTVTPLQQSGNPKPRIFRLISERAVINRLGFNNDGHAAVLARLEAMPHRGRDIIGINIGANSDQPDKIDDYIKGLQVFSEVADYFMINISSPNTPGLRDLQSPENLNDLLTRVLAARGEISDALDVRPPLVVKLSPDVAYDDLSGVIDVLMAHKVDGICISNTTLSREGVADPMKALSPGGLSGRPLFEASTRMLTRVYMITEGAIPLIGVGGIDSPESALDKMKAGASLLQLYTGLIYQGPGLVERITSYLAEFCKVHKLSCIGEVTGTEADRWAE